MTKTELVGRQLYVNEKGEMTGAEEELKTLSDTKIQLIKSFMENETPNSMIATSLEVSEQVVQLIAKEIEKENEWTLEKVQKLKNLYQQRIEISEIAKLLNTPIEYVKE